MHVAVESRTAEREPPAQWGGGLVANLGGGGGSALPAAGPECVSSMGLCPLIFKWGP